MSSVNATLWGNDPDGDSITFDKRNANGVSISWRDRSRGKITIQANTCGTSASFLYRVRDSKGAVSPWYTVTVLSYEIRHLHSALMVISTVATGERLVAMPTFSDCGNEANCSRYHVWRHRGSGSVSASCSGSRIVIRGPQVSQERAISVRDQSRCMRVKVQLPK